MLDTKTIILYIVASIVAYLFGSIPWALVIGKVFYNTDIRDFGSGNLGASNAGRVLGKNAAISAGILDILKSFVVVVGLSFINKDLAVITGMFACIGHCFPIFANFRGGKAVATNACYIMATSIFINNNFLIQVLVPLLVIIVVLYLSKMISLASIIGLTTASIIALFQPNTLVTIGIILLSALSVLRHKINIKRIIAGNENKVKWLG